MRMITTLFNIMQAAGAKQKIKQNDYLLAKTGITLVKTFLRLNRKSMHTDGFPS